MPGQLLLKPPSHPKCLEAEEILRCRLVSHVPEHGDMASNHTGAHAAILPFLPAPFLHNLLWPSLFRWSSVWGPYHPPVPTYSTDTFFSFKYNLSPHFLPETLPDHQPPPNCMGTSPERSTVICLSMCLSPITLGAPLKTSVCIFTSAPRTNTVQKDSVNVNLTDYLNEQMNPSPSPSLKTPRCWKLELLYFTSS